MKSLRKNRILYVLIGVCMTAVIVLGVSVWSLSSRLTELKSQKQPEELPPFNSFSTPKFDHWANDWGLPHQFSDLQRRLDEMMNTLPLSKPFLNKQGLSYLGSGVDISMKETADEYQFTVNVPKDHDVELNTAIKNGILTVSGVIKTKKDLTQQGQSSQHFQTQRFSQSMTLPTSVDESAMQVKQEDDMFLITLPKIIH